LILPENTMRRFASPSRAAAALLLSTFAAGSVTRAQSGPPQPQGGVSGVISGSGFTRIKIAIPDPSTEPMLSGMAREIGQTIRDDLDFSGYFEVLDPVLYPLAATSPEARVEEKWASLGASAVVLSTLSVTAGRVGLRAHLTNTSPAATLFDRRFGGPTDLARRVAHQVSDDIVQQLTGQTGIALTRIAFVSKHGTGKEVYMMDYDGRNVRRITLTRSINLMPTWSPVEQRLAYMSWRTGAPSIDILESDGRISRAPTAGGTMNISPDWSPDGRRIVYASNASGNSEIYVVDLATGRSTRLTNSPAIDTSPSFSPRGREIVFTSDRSGSPQLYVMDAEGLNVRRLTTQDKYADAAAWAPKGDKIAYASRREDGRFDVAVTDVATGAVQRLTNGEGNSENPRWAADGRHLVFASDRTGSYDLYTMRADGTDVRRLTRGGDCSTPDWSHRVP
jgi:TolB protein